MDIKTAFPEEHWILKIRLILAFGMVIKSSSLRVRLRVSRHQLPHTYWMNPQNPLTSQSFCFFVCKREVKITPTSQADIRIKWARASKSLTQGEASKKSTTESYKCYKKSTTESYKYFAPSCPNFSLRFLEDIRERSSQLYSKPASLFDQDRDRKFPNSIHTQPQWELS